MSPSPGSVSRSSVMPSPSHTVVCRSSSSSSMPPRTLDASCSASIFGNASGEPPFVRRESAGDTLLASVGGVPRGVAVLLGVIVLLEVRFGDGDACFASARFASGLGVVRLILGDARRCSGEAFSPGDTSDCTRERGVVGIWDTAESASGPSDGGEKELARAWRAVLATDGAPTGTR
jgi:hypothetical protein